jgi:hypothetical protein
VHFLQLLLLLFRLDERGALRGEVLLVGGAASVADECFGRIEVYVKGPVSDNLVVPAK